MDIYKNNISAQGVMLRAIQRSNRPLNKYNEGMHMITEELAGEPNDRTAYDCGNEPEKHNF
jgi:hypothetical protein